MAQRIRVAILSFAHYHANFWAEAFRDSPLAEFVGIWDDNAERGMEAANRFAVQFWPELSPLLETCEAVGITSETVQHRPLIEAAASHGCHILCEKPPTATLEDCDKISDIVAKAGILFMQSFPKRFDPVNHELHRMIHEGELGRIALARVRHGHFHGLDPRFTTQWYVDPALAGGGALLDEGIHGADLIRWLFGEPESVTAMISSAALGLRVEDVAVAVFRFPGGLLAELSTSCGFIAGDNAVEVYGTRGTAVLSGVDLASRDITQEAFLKIYRFGQAERRWNVLPIIPRFKTGVFHQQNPLNFLEALSRGTPPPITLEDGRRALAMILAAYRSAREERTVRFPLS